MTVPTLELAHGLVLPEDFVSKRGAIIARSGGGKTYTASVLAEELVRIEQPFYVLDPTGAWWGLRASADGRSEGLPVIVIGGQHGQLPLDPDGGAIYADLAVEQPSFYVLDLSDIGTRAGEVRFTRAFLDRLYRAKAKRRERLVGLWDEADLIAPQQSGPDEKRMLGAAEQVVRRGRIRGLVTWLITQRPAILNKNVLSQIQVLVALVLEDPRDRKAIKEWLDGTPDADARKAVLDSLAGLGVGEAWLYAPSLHPPLYERVQIRERRTFNSSADGEDDVEPVKLAEVDLEAVAARLRDVIDKAKADDPTALKAEIARLRKQLAGGDDTGADDLARAEQAAAEAAERARSWKARARDAEQALLGVDEQLGKLNGLGDDLVSMSAEAYEIAGAVDGAITRIAFDRDFTQDDGAARSAPSGTEGVQSIAAPERPTTQAPAGVGNGRTAVDGGRGRSPGRESDPSSPRAATGNGSGVELHAQVNAPRQRILDTIAWFEAIGVHEPKRSAVGPLAGTTSTSSGFEKNLSALRTAGLIDYPAGGRLALTVEGRALATAPEGTPTSEALHQAVLARLNAPRAAILRALIDAYPDPLIRADLARRVGVSASSSGFEKNLSGLRTLELIDYPWQGMVVAADLLFVDEAVPA